MKKLTLVLTTLLALPVLAAPEKQKTLKQRLVAYAQNATEHYKAICSTLCALVLGYWFFKTPAQRPAADKPPRPGNNGNGGGGNPPQPPAPRPQQPPRVPPADELLIKYATDEQMTTIRNAGVNAAGELLQKAYALSQNEPVENRTAAMKAQIGEITKLCERIMKQREADKLFHELMAQGDEPPASAQPAPQPETIPNDVRERRRAEHEKARLAAQEKEKAEAAEKARIAARDLAILVEELHKKNAEVQEKQRAAEPSAPPLGDFNEKDIEDAIDESLQRKKITIEQIVNAPELDEAALKRIEAGNAAVEANRREFERQQAAEKRRLSELDHKTPGQ